MSEKVSETIIQAWCPRRLSDALRQEAQARMTTKSAIIRQALIRELGLEKGGTQPRQSE